VRRARDLLGVGAAAGRAQGYVVVLPLPPCIPPHLPPSLEPPRTSSILLLDTRGVLSPSDRAPAVPCLIQRLGPAAPRPWRSGALLLD